MRIAASVPVRLALALALGLVLAAGCAPARPSGRAIERPAAVAAREIAIEITARGFEPASATAHVGETVRLVFTRRVTRSCVTRVTLWLDADHAIERELPYGVPVAITIELATAGEIGFACPMHVHGGRIDVN